MTLEEILKGVRLRRGLGEDLREMQVTGLEYDSRRAEQGYLFFAFAGARADGREFAQSAIDRGAVAVASELPAPSDFPGTWIEVEHGRQALALASRNFYGKPDERLGLTGVTGTNGKTTTAFLIDAVLRSAGKTTAMVGTIEYRLAGQVRTAVNTTPESLDLYRIFHTLEQVGGSHATMEVSSHALALGRVYGINFHTAVFTNLTRDHLDFHETMENYFTAKQLLFAPDGAAPPRWAVINADDAYGQKIQPGKGTQVLRYGFGEQADLKVTALEMSFEGLRVTVQHGREKAKLTSALVGKINAYNVLAACGTALSYGFDWPTIARGIAECRNVPGRFESIEEGQPFMVVVDYAHTDDALRNVISVARELHPKRVITLFGCGGDRDRSKRPLMGMAAGEASDFVVLTSDNPRSEDPIAIMNDALVGLRRFDTPHLVEPDREKAIHAALDAAKPGDIVILAGKGHEPYQVLKDRVIHFDDREVARAALRGRGFGGR
ncbi:MAG TPA: UDP-N-acetylmuramoyl-L-alanyl-D-glutamate--2,6-diaminopimelate ligase [Bryobacteraceae bacterium]|jgi:UDP-N-acetylmuramoyl-L-alanyl-D-glutamate--2,6-diaminopimelate ligase|nr:UDP-N-acetylmuramoyl-L-alanyl-D-glutamate--2,6-diaminopimelate ligase [Bryobacteraceae bacterium]